ncbi:MAG: ABC transporter ATP-binding protein [Cellulomonadaceae bacterium]|jgi:ABC-2 type transport system ATP-binding protein|nr:ABC transporter ATP-binding protein [Cellulomonadaceae bacterium]
MIEARNLVKKYGDKTAVDDITFTVQPGIVTGFLGPNGAGKSTTMRMIMGLDAPTSGDVTVGGLPYARHKSPLTEVGALLEARAVHPGRSARQHLRVLAATHGIPDKRVDEVIDLTGLESVARKRVGGFSLGMGQRLGIASALLGDPKTLILDEPVNGLDPEGVLWVRNLARYLAGEGRTVFLSSHLMSEMALTADHLIIVGLGKILADTPLKDFVESSSKQSVRVVAPSAASLVGAIEAAGGVVTIPTDEDAADVDRAAPETAAAAPTVISAFDDSFEVTGLEAAAIGELALTHGVALHELTPVKSTLEQAYMELTKDSVEYHTVDLESGEHTQQGGQR